MALPKLFQRIFWHNNTTPAINEDNLNAISKGLSDVDDRVIGLAGTIMEDVVEIKEDIEEVEGMMGDVEQYITQAQGYAQTASTKAGEASISAVNAANSATTAEAAAQTAQESVNHPPYIGQNGNWYVYNAQTDQYQDSGIIASVSVTVGTTTTLPAGSDASVTNSGTSANPILNFGIPQGEQGVQGNPGSDGVSPEVTITTITGGHAVTITDADHPSGQSFNVMDGAGTGDMQASTYDPQDAVASAGGIPSYVSGQISSGISGKMDKANPTGTGSFSLNRAANTTIGTNSFAEGKDCEASDMAAHAEGFETIASGEGAHAEGAYANASGDGAHAEGFDTLASGSYSHAAGSRTIARYPNQTAIGYYNSNKATTLLEVGNGTSSAVKNAFEVYDDGSLSTDNGATKTKLPVIRSATLAANATQVIISNVPNTGTNLIEFYTSVPGLDYTAISVSGTDVTLTYDAQATATTVYAVITEVTS